MNTMRALNMEVIMVLAKVTSKGQVTVPAEIRKKLNINDGNKILFYENEQGQIIIENANVNAFHSIRKAMEGEAEKAGIYSDEDVLRIVKEIRGSK